MAYCCLQVEPEPTVGLPMAGRPRLECQLGKDLQAADGRGWCYTSLHCQKLDRHVNIEAASFLTLITPQLIQLCALHESPQLELWDGLCNPFPTHHCEDPGSWREATGWEDSKRNSLDFITEWITEWVTLGQHAESCECLVLPAPHQEGFGCRCWGNLRRGGAHGHQAIGGQAGWPQCMVSISLLSSHRNRDFGHSQIESWPNSDSLRFKNLYINEWFVLKPSRVRWRTHRVGRTGEQHVEVYPLLGYVNEEDRVVSYGLSQAFN